MANSVDLVIGTEAIKQVETLISKLSLADAELLKISQSATAASKGITGISTPSGLDKAVTNTSALNSQLQKQNEIINKLHADLAKKAEQSRLAEIKLQQAREKSFDSFEKNAKKEALIAEKNANTYNKTQNQINNLTKVYNDLALKKERYNNLSANEEMRLTTLGKVTEKYNGILKTTDATIGKNQRNVGNYASGYNALGNSINQLSREAPAFSNSINTGFMAISNNIPALTDAIKGIREQNKLLAADGKPTVSVFKQLAGAVFSWQTLISTGVTLLTLYGGKLVDMARGLGDVNDALETLEKTQKASDNRISNTTRNIENRSEIEIAKAKRRGASIQELDALKMKGQREVLVNLEKERDLAKKTFDDASKARKSGVEDIKARQKAEIDAYNSDIAQKRKAGIKVGVTDQIQAQRALVYKHSQELKRIKVNADDEVFVKVQENYIKTENAVKLHAQKMNLLNENLLTGQYDSEKKKAKQKKAKREDIAHLESYIKPVGTTIDEINNEIERLTTEKLISDKDELPRITSQLEAVIELRRKLYGMPTADGLPKILIPDSSTEKMTKLKTDWKETFNDIAESARKAGDIIAGFSEMNIQNEYTRLSDQKDIALKFAGESAEAKAKIEEDYEKKRKEIAIRENKAKRNQALFNIAIDTAQAVVEALPNIPLAIAMGVFGAAQAVLVSSQKIPEYFAGTDNHKGGLMLVNDGGGSNYQEKVILPNGKEVIPEGRNVLMNAPKGTKVLTHEQQIKEMLNERGISMSSTVANNGMTANEMDSIMTKHFKNIQTNNTVFDRNGFRSWSEKNGNRTIQNNNRVSRTGFKV